ncbi:hypothetical protein V6N13_064451 [Hibiscus sabdariffa]
MFLWKVLHGRLPTRVELVKRGCLSSHSIFCPFCMKEPESMDYLFCHCHEIWKLWSKWVDMWESLPRFFLLRLSWWCKVKWPENSVVITDLVHSPTISLLFTQELKTSKNRAGLHQGISRAGNKSVDKLREEWITMPI